MSNRVQQININELLNTMIYMTMMIVFMEIMYQEVIKKPFTPGLGPAIYKGKKKLASLFGDKPKTNEQEKGRTFRSSTATSSAQGLVEKIPYFIPDPSRMLPAPKGVNYDWRASKGIVLMDQALADDIFTDFEGILGALQSTYDLGKIRMMLQEILKEARERRTTATSHANDIMQATWTLLEKHARDFDPIEYSLIRKDIQDTMDKLYALARGNAFRLKS